MSLRARVNRLVRAGGAGGPDPLQVVVLVPVGPGEPVGPPRRRADGRGLDIPFDPAGPPPPRWPSTPTG